MFRDIFSNYYRLTKNPFFKENLANLPNTFFPKNNGRIWLNALDNVFTKEMPFISKLSWSNEADDLTELEEIESQFVSLKLEKKSYC